MMQKIGDSTTTANAAGEYIEGNPAAGVDATLIRSEWLNTIQRELIAVVEGAGLVLDTADDSQVLKSVRLLMQANDGNFGVDAGTANSYSVMFTPAVVMLKDGLTLNFKAKTANDGAGTFSPNGLPPAPLLGLGQLPLQGGEIIANGFCTVRYSVAAGAWILLSSTGGALQLPNGSKSHHAVTLGQRATESLAGVTQFASAAEILASVISDKAVSPAGLLATFLGAGGAANNDYIKIPFRDKTTGVRRELIIQWIRTTTLGGQGAASTFPIAFPNACCGVWGASTNGASPQSIAVGTPTNTSFNAWGGVVPSSFGAIAIGY
jgi:hypothetical protein